MSSGQQLGVPIEEAFAHAFNFGEKQAPHGASLEDLLKSGAFIESSPNTFSFSCAGPRDVPLPVQYDTYLTFVRKHHNRQPLVDALFPLFCHVVMEFRRREDEPGEQEFRKKYIDSIPPDQREEATSFLDDEATYHRLSCLFSTQRYIVKTDDHCADLLREFVNQPANSELRHLIVENITLDPIREQTPDHRTILRFQLTSGVSSLSVLQCRIRNATFGCVSHDLSEVYAILGDQRIVKIDGGTNSMVSLYTHSSPITTMSLSSESKVLVTGDVTGNMHLWSGTRGIGVPSVQSSIWCSVFSPRGGIFAVGASDTLVRLYDTPNQRPIRVCVGHSRAVVGLAFHPNCALLGSIEVDPSVRIWDLRDAATVRLFIGKSQKNSALAMSPDGRLVAFFDGELSIHDLGTAKQVMRKQIHLHEVVHLSFSMDSRYLYAVGPNGTILVCDLADEVPVSDALRPNERVIACEMLPANELRIITSFDG
jgi:transcription initiation factor TFIID subunit 5